jgi:ABC-2 type transport system permease protein
VIAVEMRKQAFRLRTYIALGLMAGVPVIMTLALEFGRRPRNPDEQTFFAVATHSGLTIPLAALTSVSTFLLVVVVSLFAGGAVSEEASWGSLRYLLIRPVTRSRLLRDKLIVACVMSFVATWLITLSALIAGILFFGIHPILTPNFQVFSEAESLWKIFVATMYVAYCMTGIIALAFMISTMTDTSLGAVAGGVGLVIVSEILNAITTLGTIRGFLITHHWHAWEAMFYGRGATSDMIDGLLLQIPYVVVFLALAWWWFHRRDILA